MILKRGLVCALLGIFVLAACTSKNIDGTSPPIAGTANGGRTISSEHSQNQVGNLFELAQDQDLNDNDYDKYIDASVRGEDRKLSKQFMKFMPKNQRGDFIYLDPSGRLISNNAALLPFAKVTRGTINLSATTARSVSSTRKTLGNPLPCGPQDPPSAPKGAYTRFVSKCGFAAGWGFVSWPAGALNLPPGDAGHTYFEVKGPSGSLSEGGFEVYSDTSIAPYARVTTQTNYVSLNNNSARYFAGAQLAIFHGLNQRGQLFTEVGEASGIDPRSAWINSTQVRLTNAAWLFYAAPGDMSGAGNDPIGNYSPCTGCSVSKVTSIGQNNGVVTYSVDGSYFGVTSAGQSAIAWNQVAFGNWGNDCYSGTLNCTFMTSNNPFSYYAGAQYYPDLGVSQASMEVTLYGPYESYDSIDLTGGRFGSSAKRGTGGFTEPLPPQPKPPCAPDAYHYCVQSIANNGGVQPCYMSDGTLVKNYIGTKVYSLNNGGKYNLTYSDDNSGQCITTKTWNPGEPSVLLGDPYLP